MSSRALRRLQGNIDLAQITNSSDSDELELQDIAGTIICPTNTTSKKKKVKSVPDNPFELLNAGEGESSDHQEEGEGNEETITETAQQPQHNKATKTKRRKKKKGKKDTKDSCAETAGIQKPVDDIEASLLEVNRLLGDPEGIISPAAGHYALTLKPLLHIDYRHLNPETELKKMFGSQVIKSEQPRNRRQRNRPLHRGGRLVHPKDTWHSTSGSGLSMKYLGETEGFVFEHSLAYQKVQHKFSDAVESGQPEYIISILREHPYHVDSLIQMADLHRATEDYQTAAESIEKALFGMECAFHSMFNLASGNCFLSYRRRENRSFYLCLFKHILNLGRRGCNRTAFEFCKVLLSLDPENDPLDCMSMIDYFALRAEQFDHLVRLEQEVLLTEAMKHVPNFAMSIPLAYYKIAVKDRTDMSTADSLLQDSLLFFPMILIPLLDQCSVQPDRQVSSHSFFNTGELIDSTSELQRLITLYVKRCEPCWKEPAVISWLESNVKAVLEIVDKGQDPRIMEYPLLRKRRFRNPPLSTIRHFFLSEIQGLGLPRQYMVTTVLNNDPFPPHDNIAAYTRPARQTVASQDNSGVLRSLLHSLMPSYNPYELANMRARQPHGGEDDNEEGAAGGATLSQQFEQSVQAVMQAMRQLLNRSFGPGQGDNQEQQQGEPEEEDNDAEWEDADGEFR